MVENLVHTNDIKNSNKHLYTNTNEKQTKNRQLKMTTNKQQN